MSVVTVINQSELKSDKAPLKSGVFFCDRVLRKDGGKDWNGARIDRAKRGRSAPPSRICKANRLGPRHETPNSDNLFLHGEENDIEHGRFCERTE